MVPWYQKHLVTLLYVLCDKASSLLKVWHKRHSFWCYSDMISHTHTTHGNKHTSRTGTNRLTHINYVYFNICQNLLYAHGSYLYYTLNLKLADMKGLVYRDLQCFCISTISFVEVVYLLIRFHKTKFFL